MSERGSVQLKKLVDEAHVGCQLRNVWNGPSAVCNVPHQISEPELVGFRSPQDEVILVALSDCAELREIQDDVFGFPGKSCGDTEASVIKIEMKKVEFGDPAQYEIGAKCDDE